MLPSDPGDGVIDFASGGYPGFSDVVDLRARGRLSDEIVFRVRASQAALWRAEAFDTYEGSLWTMSPGPMETLPRDGDGVSYVVPDGVVRRNGARGFDVAKVTQTFYIETPQPNVLFGAQGARQVYFPSGGLVVDGAASIRSPILLDEGMVYSVVSDIPVTTPVWLRSAKPPRSARLSPYLQLPENLPARVGDLARQITADAATTYDRVIAVQSWIQANTRYTLDVPRDPEGVDAVDHFLFETRQGYCEHIASSMAVLLRTLGIPTRLVTGYGPGERNALTGFFEVKQSDAHAWLEVYYGSIGWVPYDPTFGVPEAAPGLASRFMAGPVFAAIGRFISTAVPRPVKTVFGAAGRGAMAVGATAQRSWPPVVAAVFAAAAVAAWFRRRRRTDPDVPHTIGEEAFIELVAALAPTGHARLPHETPDEFLRQVRADDAVPTDVLEVAELVVRTFERERYSAGAPAEAEVLRARAQAARVKQLLRH